MIRIDRGPEPAGFADVRNERLTAAQRTLDAGGQLTRTDLAGYQAAREALWHAQHRKCAYCEATATYPYNPVEHFRPALRARRGPGFPDYGYWWLAWTWENLLFACNVCNSSHKGDKFPLEAGSVPLAYPEDPPGHEIPTLNDPADPADPDPMDLIVFQSVGVFWIPTGRDGSERGRQIVQVLGLDAPAHLSSYRAHVEEYITPHVAAIQAAIDEGDTAAIHREWNHALREVSSRRPWSGLCHDALDFYVPAEVRAQYGLVLTRP